jgi:ubiquinone/menaquinone biosynthesis C-methylase UbiE
MSCLLISYSGAEEQNVNPGINEYYYDAEFDNWVSIFESPGREVYDKRHTIVNALSIKTGMAIADIGAGTGFYTYLFAQEVGASGKVYAVDISENFIKNILIRARQKKLGNIEGIINSQKSTNLESNSIDLAFICDTYHHFEYPQSMLASIHQALRAGGELVIIDFRKQPGVSSGWVMSHVRANEKDVIREVEIAGFNLTDRSELLHENFFLKFSKAGE